MINCYNPNTLSSKRMTSAMESPDLCNSCLSWCSMYLWSPSTFSTSWLSPLLNKGSLTSSMLSGPWSQRRKKVEKKTTTSSKVPTATSSWWHTFLLTKVRRLLGKILSNITLIRSGSKFHNLSMKRSKKKTYGIK